MKWDQLESKQLKMGRVENVKSMAATKKKCYRQESKTWTKFERKNLPHKLYASLDNESVDSAARLSGFSFKYELHCSKVVSLNKLVNKS